MLILLLMIGGCTLALIFGNNISVHQGKIIGRRETSEGGSFLSATTTVYEIHIYGRDAVTDVPADQWVPCSDVEYFTLKDGDDYNVNY